VSGDSLIECATIADKCAKVGAVGINCTPPRFIHGLILSIRKVPLVSTTFCIVLTIFFAPQLQINVPVIPAKCTYHDFRSCFPLA
jgi:hypothetical protein